MTDSRAAVGMDRLPWLTDEPKPRASNGSRELLGWGFAAALLIAGGSYWLGTKSADQLESTPVETPAPPQPQARVKLPEARLSAPPPPITIADTPEVRPAPAPVVAVPEPPTRKAPRPKKRTVLKREEPSRAKLEQTVKAQSDGREVAEPRRPAATTVVQAPAASKRPKLWPSRVSSGASGRLVQIGAFGSRQQAKFGWRRMQRSYPAVARLPAVVVQSRNSRGKRFYRFQIGTTSQAHSEVLCQRMRSIRYSCAVVGLPWKSKVER